MTTCEKHYCTPKCYADSRLSLRYRTDRSIIHSLPYFLQHLFHVDIASRPLLSFYILSSNTPNSCLSFASLVPARSCLGSTQLGAYVSATMLRILSECSEYFQTLVTILLFQRWVIYRCLPHAQPLNSSFQLRAYTCVATTPIPLPNPTHINSSVISSFAPHSFTFKAPSITATALLPRPYAITMCYNTFTYSCGHTAKSYSLICGCENKGPDLSSASTCKVDCKG